MKIETNRSINVPVYANELNEVVGMQMTIELGQDVVFKGIQSQQLNIESHNIYVNGNKVAFSWNTNEAISLEASDVLFSVELEGLNQGELAANIQISSSSVDAEVYDSELNVNGLDLVINERNIEAPARTVLYQNAPNPFNGMTTIAFDLEERGMATLAIFDISGKEVYRISNEFAKGKNAMTIDVQSLNVTSGLLYYTLQAGDFIDTKKMMIID